MQLVILILSAVLCIGSKVLFHACEVMGEEIMACHWAEQAVFALSIVLLVQSILLLLLRDPGVKKGIAVAIVPTAVITVLVPGVFIRLCMMDTMRCRAVFRPAVTILGILIAVAAVCFLIIHRGKEDGAIKK